MMTKVLVLGLGVSGRAAAQLLLKKGFRVQAVDAKYETLAQDPQVAALLKQGITLSSDLLDLPEDVVQVILSPGVPPTHKLVRQALQKQLEVIGEIELAARNLPNCCIGITGTNGKTTSVLLLTHLLNASGKAARALGNIGEPLSAYACNPNPDEILVIELSSFQLETLSARFLDAAVYLNLTPDHLDRYAMLEDYAKAKARIEQCLKHQGRLWVSAEVANDFGHLFSQAMILQEQAGLEDAGALKSGLPERQNKEAAFTLGDFLGLTMEQMNVHLKTFRKPKHRIEFVAEWKGVTFYNDSKATNVDAVLHALKHLQGPLILLAGGVDKGASYRPWIKALLGKVERVIVFGKAAVTIESELKENVCVERVVTLEEALQRAWDTARAPVSIVLSPGCSSFDAFQNYAHRGNEFKRMVEERLWIERKRS